MEIDEPQKVMVNPNSCIQKLFFSHQRTVQENHPSLLSLSMPCKVLIYFYFTFVISIQNLKHPFILQDQSNSWFWLVLIMRVSSLFKNPCCIINMIDTFAASYDLSIMQLQLNKFYVYVWKIYLWVLKLAGYSKYQCYMYLRKRQHLLERTVKMTNTNEFEQSLASSIIL